MHGNGDAGKPGVQDTVRKVFEPKFGGIGGNGNPRESEFSRIGDGVNDLWVGGGLSAQEPHRPMAIVVPAFQFCLHLRIGHVAAIFPLWQPVNTENAPIVTGLADIDLDIASRVAFWIERLIGCWITQSFPSLNFGSSASVDHNSTYLSNTPEHTSCRTHCVH